MSHPGEIVATSRVGEVIKYLSDNVTSPQPVVNAAINRNVARILGSLCDVGIVIKQVQNGVTVYSL